MYSIKFTYRNRMNEMNIVVGSVQEKKNICDAVRQNWNKSLIY